jgi:hypothetical protein
VDQIIRVIGALLILAAFVLSQWRVVHGESLAYLAPNLAGAPSWR